METTPTGTEPDGGRRKKRSLLYTLPAILNGSEPVDNSLGVHKVHY